MLMSEHEKSVVASSLVARFFLFVSRHAQFKILLILSLIALFACFCGHTQFIEGGVSLLGFSFMSSYN